MTIYNLSGNQIEKFEEFKSIGVRNAQRIFDAQVAFVREYYRGTRLTSADIGLSGGIDSAYTTAVAVEALGAENVYVAMMPYDTIRTSLVESVNYAELMVEHAGIPEENVRQVSILRGVQGTVVSLKLAGFPEPTRTQLGNLMARERMKILFHMASLNNGLVHDTCNKTEILFGYLTKFGDGASDINAVGDTYKTWIWAIARKLKLVPEEIIERTPSAELFAGQTDVSDMGISYEALDILLWLLYDKKMFVKNIVQEYSFPLEVVDMVVRRVNANKHKSLPTPVCSLGYLNL